MHEKSTAWAVLPLMIACGLQEPNQQYDNRNYKQEKKNAADNRQPVGRGAGFCIRHRINPFFSTNL
ncbi:hypothetical protein P378_14180 [Desulforamulus profundi]|uniref:Uncharacterized protein n=1 Tax=Desulforamulus profundi TaxID=1383067 RepID=A0A2C6MEG6_9FIRM|nr:hypothetical protein P378_14180 [Desulforamulus profundi]